MKTDLTDQEVKDYQENGFLVIKNFLSDDELENMRAAVTKSVDEMGRSRLNTTGDKKDVENWTDKDDYGSDAFIQKLNLWRINSFIKDFFINEKMGKFLSRLAGTDGMRMWHDQTLQKRPWQDHTAWHLDNPYWSFHSHKAISIWIALDDATVENGCLWYLPGSHKTARHADNGSPWRR